MLDSWKVKFRGPSRKVPWEYRRELELDDKVKKSAILVAGMHRSGTSAVCRVLSILGCTLPKTLSGSAPDNERGFWESLAVKDLNDRILASAGSAWDDWEGIQFVLVRLSRRR